MKNVIYIAIMIAFLNRAVAVEAIAVSTATATEMEQVLASMTSQSDAQKFFHFLYPGDPNTEKAKIEEAKNQLEKYREDRLKVRALVKVGTSIFAYPGILAHGEITYEPSKVRYFEPRENDKPSDPVYRLFVGLIRNRGKGPENFDIVFGIDGVIREIKTVTSKY